MSKPVDILLESVEKTIEGNGYNLGENLVCTTIDSLIDSTDKFFESFFDKLEAIEPYVEAADNLLDFIQGKK